MHQAIPSKTDRRICKSGIGDISSPDTRTVGPVICLAIIHLLVAYFVLLPSRSVYTYNLTMDSLLSAMHGVNGGHGLSTAGSGAVFGILFHQAIRPIEFEFFMFHFMAAYVVTFLLSVITLGFTTSILFASSFVTSLLLSIGVYRLVFHRCRSFPGPVAAKLTRFYAASLSAKNVQYYKELANLHAQYGDFVRTGRCFTPPH
jgi:hypothetical protein